MFRLPFIMYDDFVQLFPHVCGQKNVSLFTKQYPMGCVSFIGESFLARVKKEYLEAAAFCASFLPKKPHFPILLKVRFTYTVFCCLITR